MENRTTPKPIRCKAAVSRVPGEPLRIEEVVVAPPQAYEVRIKILCTSVCHTDVTFWLSKGFPALLPQIYGHEAVGVVESVGEHVEEVRVGDMVVPTPMAQCGECADCESEGSNLCGKLPLRVAGMPRDGTSRFTDAAGAVVHGFLGGVASFSEYTVADVAVVVKVDPAVPPEKACLLSCGASTGVGAAWKVAKVEAGSTVAIFGLGAVGFGVAEGARMRGAKRIIGVDLNPDKFEIGKRMGITNFVNPKELGERSVGEVIREMTDGGADYCFECIGLASLMSEAFQSSRIGWGKTVILGVEMHGSPIQLDSSEILRGKTVVGSLFGGLKPKIDIPILVKQYLNKELKLDEFITHEMGFQDINRAFDLLIQGKSVRSILWMDK